MLDYASPRPPTVETPPSASTAAIGFLLTTLVIVGIASVVCGIILFIHALLAH